MELDGALILEALKSTLRHQFTVWAAWLANWWASLPNSWVAANDYLSELVWRSRAEPSCPSLPLRLIGMATEFLILYRGIPGETINMWYRAIRVLVLISLAWGAIVDMNALEECRNAVFDPHFWYEPKLLTPIMLQLRLDFNNLCDPVLSTRAQDYSYPYIYYGRMEAIAMQWGTLNLFAAVGFVATCLGELEIIFDITRYTRLASSTLSLVLYACLYAYMGLIYQPYNSYLLFIPGTMPIMWVGSVLLVGAILLGLHMFSAANRRRLREALEQTKKNSEIDMGETLSTNLLILLAQVTEGLYGEYRRLPGQSGHISVSHVSRVEPPFTDPNSQAHHLLLQEKSWPQQPKILSIFSRIRDSLPKLGLDRILASFGLRLDAPYRDAVSSLWQLASMLSRNLKYRVEQPVLRSKKSVNSGTAPGGGAETASSSGVGTCVVCLDSPRNIVMWPCGCLCVCLSCKKMIPTYCPCVACGRPVSTFSRIYVP